MAGLTVWARDANRRRRGILKVVRAEALLTESGVGTFTITVDGHDTLTGKLTEDWGVIVMDGSTQVLTGNIDSLGQSAKGNTSNLELVGVSDMVALEDRITYPDPTKAATEQNTVTHYKRTGPGEALLAELINTQAGPQAITARRTPGLRAMPTGTRGKQTVIEARFTPLLEEVKSLALAAGLVVDLAQVPGTNELAVEVRVPVDRSRSVRFMPATGLGEYSSRTAQATVSAVIVGAGGQGTSRKVVERTQPSQRRIERFQDRRDSMDDKELVKAATETLAEGMATASAEFKVSELGRYRFGEHYRLGDVVAVQPAIGVQVVDRVRAVSIKWTPTGRDVEVTVGENTADPQKVPAQVLKVRKLQQQLRRIGAAQ